MSSSPRPVTPRPVTPVGILAATLDDLARRLDTTEGVGADVRSDLHRARAMAAGLEEYPEQATSPESADLARLARRTREHDWSSHDGAVHLEQEMLSGHVEGQVLKMLVAATRARRVLEIGMFTGYSALAMAEALPADGDLVACELDPGVAAFARECFDETASGARITIDVGPADESLARRAAAGDSFDLVFLDADKTGYADYVEEVLSTGLLAPHGLLAVDNTLLQGEPWLDAAAPFYGSAAPLEDVPKIKAELLVVLATASCATTPRTRAMIFTIPVVTLPPTSEPRCPLKPRASPPPRTSS